MTLCQLLLNLFFAALSAFLGVAMGVLYSKRELKIQRAKEKQNLRLKLVKIFRFNIDGLAKMQEQLKTSVVPDYRLDTESVSHILFNGRDLFKNEKWFDDFNWQRYQLTHINAKLDFINDLINLPDVSPIIRQQRFSSLVNHLRITEKEILDLLTRYEKAEQGAAANH